MRSRTKATMKKRKISSLRSGFSDLLYSPGSPLSAAVTSLQRIAPFKLVYWAQSYKIYGPERDLITSKDCPEFMSLMVRLWPLPNIPEADPGH
jgi:hypothetical protein